MNEDKVTIIDLGAFALDSIPLSISYQFKDQDGLPLDMSNGTWVGQGRAEQILLTGTQPASIGTGAVVVDSGTATATYTWHTADFGTVGTFRLVIWVGNSANREGSKVFQWEVFDSPGAAPSV